MIKAIPSAPPIPPLGLPPGRIELVPTVGELFFRDSGPQTDRLGTVLLLHGWIFPSDLNWALVYRPLINSGYRVLALDHRGHGRGLRGIDRFRLSDCAADAAALLRHLGTGPVMVVGYSMGGAIAQLMARDHPERVQGLVLCATALEWRASLRHRLFWRTMLLFQLSVHLLPLRAWMHLFRRLGIDDHGHAEWISGELSRGSAAHLAEAGRDLGRFDARPWIMDLTCPIAVVLTALDRLVPLHRQRQISLLAPDVTLHEISMDHADLAAKSHLFVPALIDALASIRTRGPERAPDWRSRVPTSHRSQPALR